MRILVFSYFYPPAYEVGGKRFANLVQNWSETGWKVGVVAAEPEAYGKLDESMAPAGEVFRSRVWPLPSSNDYRGIERLLHRFWARNLISIDRQQGWTASAVRRGIQAAASIKPRAIVATGPPFTAFVAGLRTAVKLDIPLILDYRDPWTTQISSRFPPPMGPVRGRRIESRALGTASAVVGCTERLTDQVRSGFGFPHEKFFTITNGFAEFRKPLTEGNGSEFQILHAGSFYGKRTLAPLIHGVLKLKEAGYSVKVRVIGGKVIGKDRREFEASGCSECLSVEEPLPHELALKEMTRADVLYLPSGDDVSYALPYKFFDYLSSGRPILAVCPADSAVNDYVRETACGRAFDPNDTSGIAGFLWEVHSGITVKARGIRRFIWSSLAEEYGRVIEYACSNRMSGGVS